MTASRQRPDSGIEVALEQRQRKLDQDRQLLAERELAAQEQAGTVTTAEARVRMVLMQMDAAQRPTAGAALPVAVLSDLERLLDWCEMQVSLERERLEIARGEAEEARTVVAVAHQHVRALELVLEARAAERTEKHTPSSTRSSP